MDGVNGLEQNSVTKLLIPGMEIIFLHMAADMIPCFFPC
jgi:hypothetical protein